MLKRQATVFVLLIVSSVLFTSGCNRFHPGIKGSGVRKTERRDVAAFTSISTEGAFDIDVVAQKDQSVEIEADDNVLPVIETEVKDGVLHIRTHGSLSLSNNIEIKIGIPNIERVSASGAGSINVKNLKNDIFDIDVNGAPTIRASGDTRVARIEANGAAQIDTMKLHATEVTVNSNGVSSVQVYAGNVLNVTVSGPSHVTYAGDPEVKQTVNGPGSVAKKEVSGA